MRTHSRWLAGAFVLSVTMIANAAIDLRFTDIAGGMAGVVHITHANDGSGRLFLVQKSGVIRIVKNGVVLERPFLDISGRITDGSERGLLSMAFPPALAPKDHFYLYYTDLNGDSVIARFFVSGDPDVADPQREEQILTFEQPFANHNGGQLAFGPDGMLYIASGDGGSGGDPLNSGQRTDTLLGKLLRIDVDSGGSGYVIPADNPFATDSGGARPEIWAYGLRNPWRVSFDRVSGELYIADVGQNAWEEINRQPAQSAGGENYGWNVMEGFTCFQAASCDQTGLTLPVAQYNHAEGCSVTGGHVYRGSQYAGLAGVYLFGDFCTGTIWGLGGTLAGEGDDRGVELARTSFRITTFGEDQAGNVYVADFSGGVFLISDGPPKTGTVAIGPQHSGSWYGGPSRDGEGFLLEVLADGRLVAYWFTYDAAGNQAWIFGVGNIVGDTATVPAFITDGGIFGLGFEPDLVNQTPWGTMSVTFESCNRASMGYSSAGFGSGRMAIQRLTELSGLGC